MRHYLHQLPIPLPTGSVSLLNTPKAITFSNSTEENNVYINFYNSYISAKVKFTGNNAYATEGSEVPLKMHNPAGTVIDRCNGSFVFCDQNGQILGSDFSGSINNESYYRCALDAVFCNKDKQIYDEFTTTWNGENIYNETMNSNCSNVFDVEEVTGIVVDADKKSVTVDFKIPFRTLVSFGSRLSYLLVKNFQSKLYFNPYTFYYNSNTTTLATPTAVNLTELTAYLDQTQVDPDSDPFPETLLNIPQANIERSLTPYTITGTTSEQRVKITNSINFNPKLAVIFFTDSDNKIANPKLISPTFFKISTGSEVNKDCSLDPDSTSNNPDVRLWHMTKNGLDMINSPCLTYDIWRKCSRFYVFNFAEQFSLCNNSNYINYEIRWTNDASIGANGTVINIHIVYLQDYLRNAVVEE